MSRSGYPVSLCCCVHCLCVNVYCTAATTCQPNCIYQIYHITSHHIINIISYHIITCHTIYQKWSAYRQVSTHSGTTIHLFCRCYAVCFSGPAVLTDGRTVVVTVTLPTQLSLRPLVTEYTRTLSSRQIIWQHIACIFNSHAKHKPNEAITKCSSVATTNNTTNDQSHKERERDSATLLR